MCDFRNEKGQIEENFFWSIYKKTGDVDEIHFLNDRISLTKRVLVNDTYWWRICACPFIIIRINQKIYSYSRFFWLRNIFYYGSETLDQIWNSCLHLSSLVVSSRGQKKRNGKNDETGNMVKQLASYETIKRITRILRQGAIARSIDFRVRFCEYRHWRVLPSNISFPTRAY